MKLRIVCPGEHEVEVPASVDPGVYGPCACGWVVQIQPPDAPGHRARIAQVLNTSKQPIQRLYLVTARAAGE